MNTFTISFLTLLFIISSICQADHDEDVDADEGELVEPEPPIIERFSFLQLIVRKKIELILGNCGIYSISYILQRHQYFLPLILFTASLN